MNRIRRIGFLLRHIKQGSTASDPELLSQVSGVPYDPQTGLFTVRLMNKRYTIHFPDFAVVCLDNDGASAPLLSDMASKILLVRYLLEAKRVPFKGEFYAYADMPWGNHYNQVFQGRCVKRLAFSFGFQLDRFCQVMELVGGTKLSVGDAGYEFAFLDELRLQFLLWEGDEEFPPSGSDFYSPIISRPRLRERIWRMWEIFPLVR